MWGSLSSKLDVALEEATIMKYDIAEVTRRIEDLEVLKKNLMANKDQWDELDATLGALQGQVNVLISKLRNLRQEKAFDADRITKLEKEALPDVWK